MNKSSLLRAALIPFACGKPDSAPAPPPSAEPPGSAARVEKMDAGPRGTLAPSRSTKLGPIALDTEVLDLEALFPEATIELHPAAASPREPGAYRVPTIVVRDGVRTIAEVELWRDAVAAVNAYTLPLEPSGIAGGATTAELAAAVPDAKCTSEPDGRVWCMDRADFYVLYYLERREHGYDGTPVGELANKVAYVRWVTSPKQRVALAKIPPAVTPAKKK